MGVLGSAIAEGLNGAGAKVAVADRVFRQEVLNRISAAGQPAVGYEADALDRNSLSDALEKILKDVGCPDILVNAVGGNVKEATTTPDLKFFDLPLAGLERVFALNLFGGAIMPCQVFGRKMAENSEGGVIINISSMNAFRPLTRIAGYSAAKAAVSNFTQWLAVHCAQEYNKKLRVNAIAPGFFVTDQNRALLTNPDGSLTDRGKQIVSHTPMGRFGDPSEVTGACVWLASEAGRFITGAIVPIDGGFNAYSGV
jgi:NAD(P)-dependent dehydrogenase (short-subunit alcohol dehydrogenase family)